MTKKEKLEARLREIRIEWERDRVNDIATTTKSYEHLAQEWGCSAQFVYKLARQHRVRRQADVEAAEATND